MALSDYEGALKSFIHDDDKLVTYKWISKEFEIHVNVAKDILKQYWEKYRNEESIIATFLLMGQLKDGSIRVEVVKESNLKNAKEKFSKVNCEHLYSLQKSLEDIELLAFAGEGDLRYSAIKCNEKFIRNDEEIESLRYVGNVKKEDSKSAGTNAISNKAPEKSESKTTDAFAKEKESKNFNAFAKDKESKNVNASAKEKESKNVNASAKEKAKNDTSKKKGETVSPKSSEKEKSDKPKSETKSSPTEKKVEKKVSPPSKSSNGKSNGKASKKPVQSKQSGFNHLFGKVQAKPQVPNKPKEETDESDKKKSSLSDTKEKEEFKVKEDRKVEQKEKENSQEKENRNKQSKKEKKVSPKVESKNDNKTKSKNTKEARGQKRNRSQESNAASKRKRIVIADSSDDESDKSNNEEEEEPMEIIEEPPKVARKRSPSPPAEKRENGKRMVRKTIDKTFKDEDGYLVTKRVHVYEAVSDSEDAVENKKEEPKKAKPAETKVEIKKKQTTLMNFFKKS